MKIALFESSNSVVFLFTYFIPVLTTKKNAQKKQTKNKQTNKQKQITTTNKQNSNNLWDMYNYNKSWDTFLIIRVFALEHY